MFYTESRNIWKLTLWLWEHKYKSGAVWITVTNVPLISRCMQYSALPHLNTIHAILESSQNLQSVTKYEWEEATCGYRIDYRSSNRFILGAINIRKKPLQHELTFTLDLQCLLEDWFSAEDCYGSLWSLQSDMRDLLLELSP